MTNLNNVDMTLNANNPEEEMKMTNVNNIVNGVVVEGLNKEEKMMIELNEKREMLIAAIEEELMNEVVDMVVVGDYEEILAGIEYEIIELLNVYEEQVLEEEYEMERIVELESYVEEITPVEKEEEKVMNTTGRTFGPLPGADTDGDEGVCLSAYAPVGKEEEISMESLDRDLEELEEGIAALTTFDEMKEVVIYYANLFLEMSKRERFHEVEYYMEEEDDLLVFTTSHRSGLVLEQTVLGEYDKELEYELYKVFAEIVDGNELVDMDTNADKVDARSEELNWLMEKRDELEMKRVNLMIDQQNESMSSIHEGPHGGAFSSEEDLNNFING